MDTSLVSTQSSVSFEYTSIQYQQNQNRSQIQIQQLSITAQFTDTVQFGDTPPTHAQSLNVILESAYAKLSELVGAAKDALGLDASSPLDTSPEATATRIADFALGFFDQFQQNNPDLEGTEARQAFADLIGGAIQQGIEEAQEILTALSALTEGVQDDIGTIQEIIQNRLSAFVNQTD